MTAPYTAPRSGNRTLWIVLGIVGAVLLLGCLCFAGAAALWLFAARATLTPPVLIAPRATTLSPGTFANRNWPTDLPVANGSTLSRSVIHKVNGVTSGEFTFSINAAPDDVAAFYDNQLTGDGWTASPEASAGAETVHAYSKAGRTVRVTVSPNAGGTIYRVAF